MFTSDTGRLFPETLSTWNSTLLKYEIPTKTCFPDRDAIGQLIASKEPNVFYESVENRQECCGIRKIKPLKRALAGNEIWTKGIHAEQSDNRNLTQSLEWNFINQIVNYNPLPDRASEESKDYIMSKNVACNSLHDKGFLSIGYQPCTTAIQPGEDFRAGRWWWQDGTKKECGLDVLLSEEKLNEVVKIKLKTNPPLAFNSYKKNKINGAGILIDETSIKTMAAVPIQ